MSSSTPSTSSGKKDPARLFIPGVAALTVVAALTASFGIWRSSTNAQDYETAALQNAGFSRVDVVHSMLSKSATVAHVYVTPTCAVTLNWIPNDSDSGGHWELKNGADNGGTPATSAAALLKAGACNH